MNLYKVTFRILNSTATHEAYINGNSLLDILIGLNRARENGGDDAYASRNLIKTELLGEFIQGPETNDLSNYYDEITSSFVNKADNSEGFNL